jgi:Glycosyltransferase
LSIRGRLALPVPRPLHRPSVVYGANVVADDFVQAVIQHSAYEDIELLYSDARPPTLDTQPRLVPSATPSRRELVSLRRLVQDPRAIRCDVWHDIRLRGDVRQALRIREASSRVYPVCVTHHAIGYTSLLHEFFLALLLSGSRTCDALVCTSIAAHTAVRVLLDTVAERFEQTHHVRLRYLGQLPVLPLGVDIQRFRPRDKTDSRRQTQIPLDAFVLLWVGRISPRNKADLLPLVRVMAQLVAANPLLPLLLVIATTHFDDYAHTLLDLARALGIAANVRVEAAAERRFIHVWYSAADVFVSPADNLQETFGLTPIEAMAAGLPQIVSDWNGYRDTVEHGVTGFRVPTRWSCEDVELDNEAELSGEASEAEVALAQSVVVDLEAYASYIQLLIDNVALRMDMQSASRRRAESCYSWQRVVCQHDDLWEELRVQAAREVPSRGASLAPYSQPFFHRAFNHYATVTTTERTFLSITAWGESLLRKEDQLPTFASAVLLDPAVADAIVSTVTQLAQSAGRVQVSDVCNLLAHTHVGSRAAITRHILWLAKHGFLSLRDEA